LLVVEAVVQREVLVLVEVQEAIDLLLLALENFLEAGVQSKLQQQLRLD
jgi:hypothetical protein